MQHRLLAVCLSLIAFHGTFVSPASAADPARKLLAVEGKGYLESVDGYLVLHLKGTPDEMGYQHGVLLKDQVRQNLRDLQRVPGQTTQPTSTNSPFQAIGYVLVTTFKDLIPPRFLTELKALARGAGMPEDQIIAANLIPEAFHCSGFALLPPATATGKLYHGRVLDYGVELGLQDHAVIIIQEPDGKIPFVNVTYAGFVGSVTGMNLRKISIGEMGGGGVGQWNGIPMSFLVRMVLENAATLQQAAETFKNNARTCEYYYVIADANVNSALAMKALPQSVQTLGPGEYHKILPHPVADTVILSSGERYQALATLIEKGRTKFDEPKAIRLMDAPVAMKSNLHDVLMVPADGVLWVANAAHDGQPAWKQHYYRFDIPKLMAARPPAQIQSAAQ